MSRIAYVNGRYLPQHQAAVHVEDRGYQFADGVYEVVAARHGTLVDAEAHLDRLEYSLAELHIAMGRSRRALEFVIGETMRRNRVREGIVYIQMTRGVARRDHAFPVTSRTALVVMARSQKPPSRQVVENGLKVITTPDNRWGRCDIKSVSLLANVLVKQQAREAGAQEGWMVRPDGTVSEGSSTNAWIVDGEGKLVTRDVGKAILAGITRRAVLALAEREKLEIVERPFTVAEAKEAREAFMTSTSAQVSPVVQIDDSVIANGKPGHLTRLLVEIYDNYMRTAGG
ncbi:MAG: D-amino-acid transaminase [Alphaproteobacteria bacterium]|jgi:D-alanine transaminase|nr:D-amino acid aminotransferase [Rhodospirillaceae bacterium]MDP6404580.1 D-amino-acid transaminase [Alphaproteobacteria bacterium]|tara:strand:+ start:918 stop:1775 length:858 start_codon:yes stop_codon:yes gene_type:complete